MVRLRSVRSRLLREPTFGHSILVISACVAAASLARWLLGDAARTVPFVTYFPAIVLCALLAGWRAGLASIFASMAVVNYVFMQPKLEITADWNTAVMMILFVLSCSLLVAIAQTLRSTVGRLQVATDRAEFLNQELIHRVRNSLTVVNSLAAMTHQADPANFAAVFSKRMAALAAGLDILSRREGLECDLREIVSRACEPFDVGNRIVISGTTGRLPPQSCVPLILAIHELCTNAVKYGALSLPAGRVLVQTDWDDVRGLAHVHWEEADGPLVALPEHEGLGSALLADPVLGPANLVFNPQGLRCEICLKTSC